MAKRRPGKAKSAAAAAAAAAGQPAQPFKVIAPIRDQALGEGPMTEEQQLESFAVSFLVLLFAVIMGEGVFLAVSGFVSEAADQFAQDYVYGAFSPTVGLFLACSSAYGLWKTRGNGADGQAK